MLVDGSNRERDDLETKVMKLDMELRNIQQIEERKYQVELPTCCGFTVY